MNRRRRPDEANLTTPSAKTALRKTSGMQEGLTGDPASKGSMTEALLLISDGDATARMSGAAMLEGLMAKKPSDNRLATVARNIIAEGSFEPLLAAAEKEQDTPVKIALLKALCSTSIAGEFTKPKNAIQRLEALIFDERYNGSDPEIVGQVTRAIWLHGPCDRSNSYDYIGNLRDRAMERFGETHEIPGAISGVMLDILHNG